ncbi:ABC transporter ATP-binding protein [Rossellomorea aquimaris]|uniref:Peptide ABC transporter ATP-binding protein n=1 Tax=Rossellomorea aquimaris TaxID=189382 RepID=A0A1J6VW56_9BACI|nr:ABC transporter ATP-binding protein [Rossellomorea aquimaris]OIU68612.1 peptide ABC transporter ATP-binding protein [Rossellomorea aquimaris]
MIRVENVYKSYKRGGLFSLERKPVLKGVSFQSPAGECLAIVGESGSGKSTLGRFLIGIEKPDRGTVLLEGFDVFNRKTRKGAVSAVFQDYKSSINPFFTVEKAIMEPLGKDGSRQRVEELLREVGLPSSYRQKYSHELSGGEVQRVCIARAMASHPRFLLLDEAVSSLDVTVQLQILNLLKRLKERRGMGYVFITHDIQAAAYICDRIIFFRDGRIEETAETGQLKNVRSDYARKLLGVLSGTAEAAAGLEQA